MNELCPSNKSAFVGPPPAEQKAALSRSKTQHFALIGPIMDDFEYLDKAGALIIAPSWASSGSYEVFKSQVRTLTILGFETYFLAVPHIWISRAAYKKHVKTYLDWSSDLRATYRAEVELPFRPFRLMGFELASKARTTAFRATQCAQLMTLPVSLMNFVRKKRELVVLCNHFFNVPLVKKLEQSLERPLKFALETHDIQSRHYKALHQTDEAAYQSMLTEELSFVAEADELIHISADELPIFAEALPNHRHHLVYPTVPEREIKVAQTSETTFLIVASLNEPNADSINWFLTTVWSRYTGEGSLKIVGNIDDLMKRRYPLTYARWSSVFVGRVADVSQWYNGAVVVILPTTAGEGLSIKFVEAMAFGKVVLFTPRAVRGLPAETIAHLADGLCPDADTLLAKMMKIPASAPIQVDPGSLKIYRDLFSQERHTAAYDRITRSIVNRLDIKIRSEAALRHSLQKLHRRYFAR